ncbi:hypothetical protein F4778DRAFT_729922 [Xylariomycetidae sp. FL2044]|nr:hypothetical protein F4778DRAFT_729922 [Xylariomycetidae sp. FL2044]
MSISVEAIIALVSLFVALPPVVLILWKCATNRARLQTRRHARQEETNRDIETANEFRYPLQPSSTWAINFSIHAISPTRSPGLIAFDLQPMYQY